MEKSKLKVQEGGKTTQDVYDVIVVGGGASGMMAAGRAAEVGARVLLLEKNSKMGEKLKITGGGRCNIANAEYDVHALLAHYGAAAKYLYSIFSRFGVADTFYFFEKRGLPLVIEGRKRAFPRTEKAIDVYNVLEEYIREGGVAVKTSSAVTRVNCEESNDEEGSDHGNSSGQAVQGKQDEPASRIVSVSCGEKEYLGRTFIFATGGASHRETGSTGDGFGWLRKLGHTVASPTPSIVPLAVSDMWVKKLAGISVEEMKIVFFVDGVRDFSKKGRILFTHFGLSGPLILNSAQKVSDLLKSGTVTAAIDLFPAEDIGIFEKRVVAIFDANKNKMLKNVLGEILPAGISKGIESLVERLNKSNEGKAGENIDLATKVHSVTRDDRKKLIRLLKSLPVTITGLMGNDRAVVSDGGVTLGEIDARTCASKAVDNLFVTGDLLHINRPSGGYSLQLCWTTGYVAGEEAVTRARSFDSD